jgi:hypothetical protein
MTIKIGNRSLFFAWHGRHAPFKLWGYKGPKGKAQVHNFLFFWSEVAWWQA